MNTLNKNKNVYKFIQYFLLIAGACVFITPLIWLLSNSFKSYNQIIEFPPKWFPNPFITSNYTDLFDPDNKNYLPMLTFIINSILVTAGVVIGTTFSTILVGYAFARLKCRFKNFYFVILLGTLMIPQSVLILPLFVVYKNLAWLDTLKSLIVPSFFGNAYFIFLMRQFLMSLPYELDESAYIDGASKLQILFKILIPLCKPILITVMVLSFIWTWTDFYSPLIFLTSENKMTLAVGLVLFRGQRRALLGLLSAATVISIIPMVVLFLVAQKYFVEGISTSGLKG
ncbi:MAG: Sugar transporter permease [Eubacterium sp.]|nr:Sugar transporter permease [Eubacterium sp.]